MSSLLKEILKQTEQTKRLLESQTKETLKNVASDVVADLIKESIVTEGEDFEDDTDTSMDTDNMGVDAPIDMDDSDGMDDGMDDDENSDFATDDAPDTEFDDTEDTGHDLSDLSSDEMLAEIERLLQSGEIDENTPIIIKKSDPTFSIQTGDVSDGTPDIDLTEEACMGDDCEDEPESVYENKEYIAMKKLVEQYEVKLRKQKSELVKATAENKTLNEELTKHKNVLTETKGFISNAVLTNTNLAHVVQLFNNKNLSNSEKFAVVEKFDKVQTINESKLLFDTLSNPIVNQRKKDNEKLSESVKTNIQTKVVEKVIIKEEKTYSDPVMDMMRKIN
jgi:hypothetical protein